MVTTQQTQQLAVREKAGAMAAPEEWPPEKVQLLRETLCKDANEDELKLFVAVCGRTALDPWARQIYLIIRREWDEKTNDYARKASIQIAIDGWRIISERSGKYAGMLGPEWCGPDGKWTDVWLDVTPPAAARVGLLRKDWKAPMWTVARWSSYAQKFRVKGVEKIGRMWAAMPDVMIANAAERLGRRRAFPFELSIALRGLPGADMIAIEGEEPAATLDRVPPDGDGVLPPGGELDRENWEQLVDVYDRLTDEAKAAGLQVDEAALPIGDVHEIGSRILDLRRRIADLPEAEEDEGSDETSAPTAEQPKAPEDIKLRCAALVDQIQAANPAIKPTLPKDSDSLEVWEKWHADTTAKWAESEHNPANKLPVAAK